MTTEAGKPETERQHANVLGGLLAAAALFLGLIALAYHPLTLAVTAMLLGLVAVAMSPRHQTLAAIGLGAAAIGFVGGCTVAILTGNPLW
jgi:hypothetical protein